MGNTQTASNEFESKGHQLEVSMARFIRTQKMIDTNNDQSIAAIIDLDDLKDIMVPFYEMTGLGVGLFDKNNRELVSVGWQKICTKFHQQHPEAHKSCVESERYLRKHFEPNTAISYKCNNGLWDMAYPIYVDDELWGSIYFGQFFFDTDAIDKTYFLNQASRYNFDQEAYIGLLKEVPILSRQKINAYIKLFVTIVEKIANVGKL